MTGREARAGRWWALVGAVAVVALVVGLVVAYGIIPYPELPTVAEQPEPEITGQLAFTRYDRGPDACVHVVDGRGEAQELRCSASSHGDVVWRPDGRLALVTYEPDATVLEIIDPQTGDVEDRVEVDAAEPTRLADRNADGEQVRTGGRDGRHWVEVTDGEEPGRRVLELEGPASYQLYEAGWTEDGNWIVVRDSIGRVLVVDADGREQPRIWSDDVGPIAVR